MIKCCRLFFITSVLTITTLKLFALNDEKAQMEVFAEIEPLFSTEISSPLNFGKILIRQGNENGIVKLQPNGIISSNSDDIKIVTNTALPGTIKISGNPGEPIYIRYSDTTLTNLSNNQTMKIKNVHDNISENGKIILNNDYQQVSVGADLNINKEQTHGIYRGVLNIFLDR